MGLDTMHSDHDIFLHIKDGDEDMVQLLYEDWREERKDLKLILRSARNAGMSACTLRDGSLYGCIWLPNLLVFCECGPGVPGVAGRPYNTSTLQTSEAGAQGIRRRSPGAEVSQTGSGNRLIGLQVPQAMSCLQGYYRTRDFDLVPLTVRDGEKQWDPKRRCWQPILHKNLAPRLQQFSGQHPDGYLVARILKFWNESLPPLRHGKAPFVSIHLPLMLLAARDHGRLEPCQRPQGYMMAAAEFISEVWQKAELDEKDVTWKEVAAEPHLERITRKYLEANMEKE